MLPGVSLALGVTGPGEQALGAGMGSSRTQTFILLCPQLLPQSLPVLLADITSQSCHCPMSSRGQEASSSPDDPQLHGTPGGLEESFLQQPLQDLGLIPSTRVGGKDLVSSLQMPKPWPEPRAQE